MADAPVAQGTLAKDARERLRKSLQSCLRQTLLHLVTVLDTSELGTLRLLAVPLSHLRPLVPGSNVEGLACAEQWTALARSVGTRKGTAHRHDLIVSGTLHYEPNLLEALDDRKEVAFLLHLLFSDLSDLSALICSSLLFSGFSLLLLSLSQFVDPCFLSFLFFVCLCSDATFEPQEELAGLWHIAQHALDTPTLRLTTAAPKNGA